MGLLIKKHVPEFESNKTYSNKRIELLDYEFFKRIEITFPSEKRAGSPIKYMTSLERIQKMMPIPTFLLKNLLKYDLSYGWNDQLEFATSKTVVYIHGAGGYAEDNSILHRMLLDAGATVIRVDHDIDYGKFDIPYPSRASEMIAFLNQVNDELIPLITGEMLFLMERLRDQYVGLFKGENIVIGHSLGAGIAADFIDKQNKIRIHKYINLDGTLFNDVMNHGLDMPCLHLSQDANFDAMWFTDQPTSEIEQLGLDYGLRIKAVVENSHKAIWIQLKRANHLVFTDLPNLVTFNGLLKKFTGQRDTATRFRQYVLDFIEKSTCDLIEGDQYL